MSELHAITIWQQWFLGGLWVADCKCGWKNQGRDTIEAATRDGDGHHAEPRRVA